MTIINVEQLVNKAIPHLLPHYRFRDKDDIEYYFQRELDKFPRMMVNGRKEIMLSEFGAIMIRPKRELRNRLTHLVFPETILSIPKVIHSLRDHSSRTYPDVRFMAEAKTANLYIKVIAYRVTPDGFPEQLSLILSTKDAFFTTDIWEAISLEDQQVLANQGFGPGMDDKQWAKKINEVYENVQPTPYATTLKGDFIFARELPICIAKRGAVGARGSFHLMPGFILEALEQNRFIFEGMTIPDNKEKIPYEIGSAHIHPIGWAMSPLQKAIADIVGEGIVRRTPSIPDIAILRASYFANREICQAYRQHNINTMESFLGILTVDKEGKVKGSRYFDLGDADQDKIKDINKRATVALQSTRPDIKVLVDHYRYVDSLTKEDFGTPGTSQHIGDPEFERKENAVRK